MSHRPRVPPVPRGPTERPRGETGLQSPAAGRLGEAAGGFVRGGQRPRSDSTTRRPGPLGASAQDPGGGGVCPGTPGWAAGHSVGARGGSPEPHSLPVPCVCLPAHPLPSRLPRRPSPFDARLTSLLRDPAFGDRTPRVHRQSPRDHFRCRYSAYVRLGPQTGRLRISQQSEQSTERLPHPRTARAYTAASGAETALVCPPALPRPARPAVGPGQAAWPLCTSAPQTEKMGGPPGELDEMSHVTHAASATVQEGTGY